MDVSHSLPPNIGENFCAASLTFKGDKKCPSGITLYKEHLISNEYRKSNHDRCYLDTGGNQHRFDFSVKPVLRTSVLTSCLLLKTANPIPKGGLYYKHSLHMVCCHKR